MKINKKQVASILFSFLIFFLIGVKAYATGTGVNINFDVDNTAGSMGTLEVLILFSLIAVAPSILLMMTSFTRVVMVLSFLRNAMGTQSSPPTQVIVGLSLFLTLFIMQPVLEEVKTTAYDPYKEGTMTSEEAFKEAQKPVKAFMIRQTEKEALDLFVSIANIPQENLPTSESIEDLSTLGLEILVPAFITSELEHAFTIGFLIFLPFLIIDIVVSSVLMSMGMMMLPPAMIALPFKIMMFVLIDGWSMLLGTLVRGFI